MYSARCHPTQIRCCFSVRTRCQQRVARESVIYIKFIFYFVALMCATLTSWKQHTSRGVPSGQLSSANAIIGVSFILSAAVICDDSTSVHRDDISVLWFNWLLLKHLCSAFSCQNHLNHILCCIYFVFVVLGLFIYIGLTPILKVCPKFNSFFFVSLTFRGSCLVSNHLPYKSILLVNN